MLFALSNIQRRSVRDPDGEMAVVPRLLHGRASLRLVEQAINVFLASVGQPRAAYDPRALEEVMGDYRLGRCIEACLLTRYSFMQPQISDLLGPEELASLAALGIASPSDLRLSAWDAANRQGGFVAPQQRISFMEGLASRWGVRADEVLVDALLGLDTEAHAVLTQTGPQPEAAELMRLYNRGMVNTLLAHSTQVRFNLGSLPGDALRKAYFIAKRSGVLVDIENGESGGFVLLLYGPEQAFGSADKYGRRLARVAQSLLRTLLGAGYTAIQGTALLVMHERPYRFHLTAEVLTRLEYAPEISAVSRQGKIAESAVAYSVGEVISPTADDPVEGPSFDSLVEAALYSSFKALERQGYTNGWSIQREPDPIVVGSVVLIPDFAFLRGGTRVFLEVAGFWSPQYRERKVAKLSVLAQAGDDAPPLLLAVPRDAAETFSGLPFHTVVYKNEARPTDVLALLNSHYGDRAARFDVAGAKAADVQALARKQRFVPEREIAGALEAYSRSELLALVPALEGDSLVYVSGVGLFTTELLGQVYAALLSALDASPGKRIPLDEASAYAASLLNAPALDLESLLAAWPNLTIERPSLFESYLVVL